MLLEGLPETLFYRVLYPVQPCTLCENVVPAGSNSLTTILETFTLAVLEEKERNIFSVRYDGMSCIPFKRINYASVRCAVFKTR